MGSWLRGVTAHARTSPVRFSLVAAGAVLLIGATAYLGTASVLWHQRVSDLRQTTTELSATLSSQVSTNGDNADQIDALGTKLDSAQSEILSQAHRKALMQDDQIAYREVSAALKTCADERSKVVTTVQDRRRYILWTVHDYDDSVTFACDPVVSALHAQMVGESK